MLRIFRPGLGTLGAFFRGRRAWPAVCFRPAILIFPTDKRFNPPFHKVTAGLFCTDDVHGRLLRYGDGKRSSNVPASQDRPTVRFSSRMVWAAKNKSIGK